MFKQTNRKKAAAFVHPGVLKSGYGQLLHPGRKEEAKPRQWQPDSAVVLCGVGEM